MSRNQIWFTLFMLLLLIAPQIPIEIPGGIARSNVSLGLVGLVLWFFANPKKIFFFPRIDAFHPLFWIIIFAAYAFTVSLLSGSVVSVAYSVQFLAYAVFGTVLLRRYARDSTKINSCKADLFFFAVPIIYSIGMIISLFTGPIYPHQTIWTARIWGGFYIQQAVGFSECQNMAGGVVVFFAAACIYMYTGKTWKKWILLCVLLLALLATLSRSAIISFLLALSFVCCLDNLGPIVLRASIKVSVLKNIGLVMSAIAVAAVILATYYAVNKSLLLGILPGFGLSGEGGSIASDTADRFNLWALGLDNWSSASILKMIFGGGFRSSMGVTSTGAWKTAHNVYIAILGDFGIIGLTLFSVALFRAFFHYTRSMLSGKARDIERFGLMTILALSIHNMTEVFYYSPVYLSLLVFTFAITI